MPLAQGLVVQANYAGAANDKARVALLRSLIPDPDKTGDARQMVGVSGYFDQMSPLCAAQLRAELVALEAAVL